MTRSEWNYSGHGVGLGGSSPFVDNAAMVVNSKIVTSTGTCAADGEAEDIDIVVSASASIFSYLFLRQELVRPRGRG